MPVPADRRTAAATGPSPLPSLRDAVDHARHVIREATSNDFARFAGWASMNTGLPAGELIVILDALAAATDGASPNPWTITGGLFEWTGPEVLHIDDSTETARDRHWVVATGHLDPPAFVRATRWVAEHHGHAGPRCPWRDVVTETGLQHAHVTRPDPDVYHLDFTADPADGSMPVTAWGPHEIAGVTIHYE